MAISDKERRAVAARMREILRDDPHGWLDMMVAKAVVDVMGEGVTIGETVADLIDRPTCHNIYDENKGCANGFMCSTCGHAVEDYEGYRVSGTWNYCPNCGAKVLDDGE